MNIHRSHERGHAEHGWLRSQFSFSFAQYHDPSRMGFGALRVINDDEIEPNQGFGMHPHRDMEIITIVTQGAIEHKDSEGHYGVTRAGEIQYMSAGTGIFHSEFNPSHTEITKLFQIWIYPKEKGGIPLYDQRSFDASIGEHGVFLLVSPDGREGSMPIRQDAFISMLSLQKGEPLVSSPTSQGHGRLYFVMEGSIAVNGIVLNDKDELQITESQEILLQGQKPSKILLFEVPMANSTEHF